MIKMADILKALDCSKENGERIYDMVKAVIEKHFDSQDEAAAVRDLFGQIISDCPRDIFLAGFIVGSISSGDCGGGRIVIIRAGMGGCNDCDD